MPIHEADQLPTYPNLKITYTIYSILDLSGDYRINRTLLAELVLPGPALRMIFDRVTQATATLVLLVCSVALGPTRAVPNPLEVYTEVTQKTLDWLKAGNDKITDQKLPITQAFSELGLSNKDTLKMIAETLYCASEDIEKHKRCTSHYHWLLQDTAIYRVDDKSKSLYLGYSFFINKPPLSPDHQRLLIYESASALWENVSKLVSRFPSYQQFHVGYRTGGSLAALIAFRVASTKALPFFKARNNSANQIKAITLSQYPILPRALLFDPIGNANFAALREANEAPAGEKDDEFIVLGTPIVLRGYSPDPIPLKLTNERLMKFISLKSRAEVNLVSMKESRYEAIKNDVSTRLALIKDVADDFVKVFPEMAHRLYGYTQDICVAGVEQLLHDYLPHSYDHEVSCQVRDRRGVTSRLSKTEFTIRCSLIPQEKDESKHQVASAPRIVFASYDSRLAIMSEQENACDQLKGTLEEDTEWSICISDLVRNSHELALISSHTAEKGENCRFIPGPLTNDWGEMPKGCFIKPQTSDDMLRLIYEQNPRVFYSLIDPRTMDFPKSCTNILYPILYRGSQIESIQASIRIAARYLKAMNRDDSVESTRRDPYSKRLHTELLPGIFRQHSTEQYITQSLKLSNNHFVADENIARGIIKCISNENTKFLDCTIRANQWIPGACPDFCAEGKGTEVCRIIAWCHGVKAFVGTTNVNLPLVNGALIDGTLRALEVTNMAQYALYRYSEKTLISKLLTTTDYYLGVFFPNLPVLERINAEELRLKRGKGRQRVDDEKEIWYEYGGIRPIEETDSSE